MVINKKGDVSKKVVAIVLVLISLVFGAAIIMIFGDVDTAEYRTMACTFSNKLKSVFPKAMGVFSGQFIPIRFCKPLEQNINPVEWGECSSEFQDASAVDSVGASRNCTMQQLWDLAVSCWEMGEEGTGSFTCYWGRIVEEGSDFGQEIKSDKELRVSYVSTLKSKLGCEEGVKSVIDKSKSGCSCHSGYVSNLANHYASLVKYNSLVSYYHDFALGDSSQPGKSFDGYAVHCAKSGVGTGKLASQLGELDSPTQSEVSSIVGGKIDASKEDKCSKAVEKITWALNQRTEYAKKANTERNNIKSALQRCISDEHGVDDVTGKKSKTARIDYLMGETTELTTSVPMIGAITKSDITRFGNNTKPKYETSTYLDLIGGKENLNFADDYRITQGSAFEIVYCDVQEFGAGTEAFFGTSCTFEDTKVMLGGKGTGTGGVTRAGSPYCSMLELVPLDYNVASKVCEARYWKTGTSY